MVAITATNYANPPNHAWQDRARVARARQEADQAESRARELRSEADQAEQDADSGRARVSELSAQATQNENTYSAQVQRQRTGSAQKQVQAALAPVSTAAANQFSFPSNPLQSSSRSWTTTLQRPSTGRLLDQSA